MGDIRPTRSETTPPKGLTPIHPRIHCVATPDTEAPDYTEAERVMVDNFLNTLAEVAIAAATRKRSERSE